VQAIDDTLSARSDPAACMTRVPGQHSETRLMCMHGRAWSIQECVLLHGITLAAMQHVCVLLHGITLAAMQHVCVLLHGITLAASMCVCSCTASHWLPACVCALARHHIGCQHVCVLLHGITLAAMQHVCVLLHGITLAAMQHVCVLLHGITLAAGMCTRARTCASARKQAHTHIHVSQYTNSLACSMYPQPLLWPTSSMHSHEHSQSCAQKTSSYYTNPHAHTGFLVLARCGHFCKEDVVLIEHKRESVSCGDHRVRTHAAELDIATRARQKNSSCSVCTWRLHNLHAPPACMC
jgi:hypothetical protein